MGNELFAIDGCKMSLDAAKEWSGTFKELGEKRDKLKRLIRHHLHEHHERVATAPKSTNACKIPAQQITAKEKEDRSPTPWSSGAAQRIPTG